MRAAAIGAALMMATLTGVVGAGPEKTVESFAGAAKKAGVVVEAPRFETTPEEIRATADGAMAEADARLGEMAGQDVSKATFESTIGALDDILYPVVTVMNRLWLMKETQPEDGMRDAASEHVTRLEQWLVGVRYREDVYGAVKAFSEAYEKGARGAMKGEDLKLYKDTMRDYRRAGLALEKSTRDKVEALQKKLSALSNEFGTNITNAEKTLLFTAEEMQGVPASFLERAKQADGKFAVRANVTPDYMVVMQNADVEATRRALDEARMSLANSENGPILNELVAIRDEIATLLGYASWADYQTEPRMAKTGARAVEFLERLRVGLRPKFDAEMGRFAAMKASDTGSAGPVMSWDWRYYENQLKKREFEVDAEALRVYFPYGPCLTGMFDIYQQIFGLKFDELKNEQPWAPGVTLWMVSDASSGEPMGMFYLDMFPRRGKYNHFAQFDVIGGKRLKDGRYQRPVAALVCNFPEASGDKPSLMAHHELETLFHEFGHAMHTILTRAERFQFAGTNVERDFVEAPSQMLEAWAWDAGVLDRFAADYRDSSQKIDADVLERMKAAKLATSGVYYTRQVGLAMSDLSIHMAPKAGEKKDCQQIINRVFGEVFVAPPQGSHFGAYWGHLTGYDAGYYGYSWAKAIAEDMATVFEKAPKGFMDKEVGMRLRNEVYAPGGSRDAEESVRAFLGRERSIEPLLEAIGVK
ncbi:MAG: M3 family metallopeptidase [Phycisphaerales bacterium]